jgi:hypothetical protein
MFYFNHHEENSFKNNEHLLRLKLNCILSPVLIVLIQAHWTPRELESLKVLHTVVGSGANNKFGSCWQWREWNFLGLLFSFINRNSRYELPTPLAIALEASHRHYQGRGDACTYTDQTVPTARWIFMAALAIRILIANSCARCRWILKGISQDGGRADFCKILRASLFNNDLSNEPNFSRIHLAGQYL